MGHPLVGITLAGELSPGGLREHVVPAAHLQTEKVEKKKIVY